MKPTKTATFPVYGDLTAQLKNPESHPNERIAHTLAACSAYAYADEDTVAMIMARMGLEKNQCLRISESVDAMLIRSTAFLVQSQDGSVVILCFRGTTPLDFINWLVDIDINPGNIPMSLKGKEFNVHGGFYRNVRAIRFEIVRALERAANGRSILPTETTPMAAPMQALYVTGHSLGGAMAALMTIMLKGDPYELIGNKLQAAYTYGQPMVGGPDLAEVCNQDEFLGQRVIRYVYGKDIIPQLPPSFTDTFSHFGPEYRHERGSANGSWLPSTEPTKQLRRVLYLLAAPLSIVTSQTRRFRKLAFRASLEDHFPRHYVTALTPPQVRTEFGD